MNKLKKIKVALLFGGKSAEHEVSFLSARNIYNALDKEKYDVVLIVITKTGQWLLGNESMLLSGTVQKKVLQAHKEYSDVLLVPASKKFYITKKEHLKTTCDVVFPILHGPYGEDGSVQGLLEIIDVPYIGAGVLGSAVGMDKDVMKRLLRDAGLPVGKFFVFYKHEKTIPFAFLKKHLGLPLFVKPANLGSSVGVSRIETKSQYKQAIKEAFRYDQKIIIEEYVPGREIECAVLGNENPIASLPGEIITNVTNYSFYSYEAKYLDEHGAELAIPAKLTRKKTKEVQYLAIRVFKALCCEGMGRVDFFMKDDGSLVINEINTIPGFTSISMYPKLWKDSGITYRELIDMLIRFAIERHQKKEKFLTSK